MSYAEIRCDLIAKNQTLFFIFHCSKIGVCAYILSETPSAKMSLDENEFFPQMSDDQYLWTYDGKSLYFIV